MNKSLLLIAFFIVGFSDAQEPKQVFNPRSLKNIIYTKLLNSQNLLDQTLSSDICLPKEILAGFFNKMGHVFPANCKHLYDLLNKDYVSIDDLHVDKLLKININELKEIKDENIRKKILACNVANDLTTKDVASFYLGDLIVNVSEKLKKNLTEHKLSFDISEIDSLLAFANCKLFLEKDLFALPDVYFKELKDIDFSKKRDLQDILILRFLTFSEENEEIVVDMIQQYKKMNDYKVLNLAHVTILTLMTDDAMNDHYEYIVNLHEDFHVTSYFDNINKDKKDNPEVLVRLVNYNQALLAAASIIDEDSFKDSNDELFVKYMKCKKLLIDASNRLLTKILPRVSERFNQSTNPQ